MTFLGNGIVGNILPFFVGIWTGILVNDITANGKPDGSKIWHTMTTLYLLICFVIQLLSQALREKNIRSREAYIDQFKDVEFCRAYLYAETLPTVAQQAKQQILAGNTDEGFQLMAKAMEGLKSE